MPIANKAMTIVDVRVFTVRAEGAGGDYHRQADGHWLIDTLIANPMSGYPEYKASRTSWGIGVLGSIVVEIETAGGHVGIATGFGGPPACWLILNHFRRFLIGADARSVNLFVGPDVPGLDVLWTQRHAHRRDFGG